MINIFDFPVISKYLLLPVFGSNQLFIFTIINKSTLVLHTMFLPDFISINLKNVISLISFFYLLLLYSLDISIFVLTKLFCSFQIYHLLFKVVTIIRVISSYFFILFLAHGSSGSILIQIL